MIDEIQFSAITIMQEQNALKNAPVAQSKGLGGKIPRLYGRVTVTGNIFWLRNNTVDIFTFNNKEVAFATFALGLGIGPAYSIGRIWANDKLIFNILTKGDLKTPDGPDWAGVTEADGVFSAKFQIGAFPTGSLRFFPGTTNQPYSRVIAEAEGVENTPRFPSLCYLDFSNFPLYEFDNNLDSLILKVELIKYPSEDFHLHGEGGPV